MPTLYHAPLSRSTSILVLIEEMGIADRIDVQRSTSLVPMAAAVRTRAIPIRTRRCPT